MMCVNTRTTSCVRMLFLCLVLWITSSQQQECVMLSPQQGTITSPNYPVEYDHNLDLCWTISNDQFCVNITVIDFELETSARMYDYLRFYSGDRTSGTELGTFWDTSPDSMMTCYPVVTIVFYTDGTINARGFHLTYEEEAKLSHYFQRTPNTLTVHPHISSQTVRTRLRCLLWCLRTRIPTPCGAAHVTRADDGSITCELLDVRDADSVGGADGALWAVEGDDGDDRRTTVEGTDYYEIIERV